MMEFQCTENDYKRFYKLSYKNKFQKYILVAVFIPLLVAYMFFGEPFDLIRFIYGFMAFEFLFILGFYVIPYIISIKKLKHLIAKEPRYLEQKKIGILDEGLSFETATRSGVWKWESIVSIDSNIEFVSLLLANKSTYLIPKRAFTADDEAINFIGMIQSKIDKQNATIKNNTKISNKPSYYLGLICLIPLIGAIAGLVFVILGITKYKDKWFTLIGVAGIAFTIIIYSSLFYATKHSSLFKKGFRELSQIQMNKVFKDIEFYKLENGQYPDSLQQLTEENLFDPIQSNQGRSDNLFRYQKVDDKYRLFSLGEDGKPNTADDLYPQVSKNLVGKIGLIRYDIKQESTETKNHTNH